jgi:5-formyltetrahydrofolate cyclo-ligase
VRLEVLEARDATDPSQRALWSEQIAERLLGLSEVKGAGSLLLFWSFGSEVDTRPAIDRALAESKLVALPRVVEGDIEPASWRPGEPLKAASFGAMEPIAGRVLDLSELDIVVTPGVAFDPRGYRVGYGGGFYDRMFSRLERRTERVGIGFEIQAVGYDLPRGAFDLPIDTLVTQDRVLRFDARSSRAPGHS